MTVLKIPLSPRRGDEGKRGGKKEEGRKSHPEFLFPLRRGGKRKRKGEREGEIVLVSFSITVSRKEE